MPAIVDVKAKILLRSPTHKAENDTDCTVNVVTRRARLATNELVRHDICVALSV